MRDVEVGEEIPADAYNGPELMVWRVDIADQPPAIPLEETPAVLPLREVLEKEEREVLRTVLRSVQKEEERRATSTSVMDTPRQKLFDGDALSPAGPPTVTKAPVATDASPAVPMRCHTPPPVEQTQPPKSLLEELTPEPRRSATIAAALSPRQVIPPPPPAHLLAVRLGKHTYHVPEERQQHYLKTAHEEDEDEEVVDQPARATKKGKRNRPVKAAQKTKKGLGKKQFKKEEPLAAPYQLQFTSSHWKWAMDNPNQQEKNKKEEEDAVFHCMLPTSSILSLMACEERRGLAVELKDGCSLPLIDASLLQGGDQNRWVVWLLEEEDNNTNSQDNSEASTYFSQLLRNLEVFYAQSKFCPPYCVEANIFDQIFAPSRQKVSS
ncbi:hypothetical protein, conserved [Angomonas deanei]|uniref:Uncharacterized protein n=1 Tax=Angomonas deanei TaxID=59799 RepID=A0A7G2CJX9_9TRYP|nr:hypothetical protein, conserved [Angomonas deanei]